MFRSVFLVFFVVFAVAKAEASDVVDDNPDLESFYNLGVQYQSSSFSDSAKVLYRYVLERLDERAQLNSRLALDTRLRLAMILLRQEDDFHAQQLLDLVKQASEQEEWDIVAYSYVLLGLVYETLGQSEKCAVYLDKARDLISRYDLKTVYPRYAIGRSSYFRVFNIDRDSALYYAQEALRTTPPGPNPVRADGNFLVGSLISGTAAEKMAYIGKSADVYLQLQDYFGHVAMLCNITRKYMDADLVSKAKVFSDSTFGILNRLPDNNYDHASFMAYAAELRASIFKAWGQVDSAWLYNDMAHQANLEYTNRVNARAITEVEERYRDAEKNQQLEQQAQQLASEKKRRNGAVLLLLLALVVASVLSYFYVQLRKANQKNKAQAERLANLDKAKSRFFANISHELRTPLALMVGPIQALLKEKTLTPRQRELLKTADRSGKQLQELVNEVLDLHKMEMSKMEVESRPTLLRAFFLRYCAQFESLASRKGIDYRYTIELEEGQYGGLDREKCRQILYNLLSNAFKFTPKRGEILVEVRLQEGQLQLSVTDTGEGIHEVDIPEVFDRYFQTNRVDKPIEGGTGIGLALCKEYVHLFGGDISVKSTLGEGATFFLSFPILLTTSALATPVTENPELSLREELVHAIGTEIFAMGKGHQASVLVVEDNIELSEYLRLILQPHYKVITAENGFEAWELLTKSEEVSSSIQLVISDLMMPIMDGYQLLEKLKGSDHTRHLPVIMLTARADARDKLRALRIGVDDYLLKPFEEEELLVRINNLLRNKRIRQEQDLEEATLVDQPTLSYSQEDQQWLANFEAFVAENLSSDLLAVAMLAESFAMSESTLLRQLKRLTGLTPNQYLKEMRLNQARQLIEKRAYNSIAQVAYAIGYTDPKSFSRAFKRKYGQLPSTVLENT